MTSYTVPINIAESTTKRFDYLEWGKNIISTIISVDQTDHLSFMESFDFPELNELKTSLTNSGHYAPKQVDEIIEGLSTLPEYSSK